MTRNISQKIVNYFGKQVVKNKSNLVCRIFHLYLRKILIRLGDPLIKCNVHGYELKLPLSHRLPINLKSCPYYSSNLGRIASYAKNKYSEFKLIDIGANVGDSVAILRAQSYFPILCVEGDYHFLNILQENMANFSDVSIAPTFVGDTSGLQAAKVIKHDGTAYIKNIEDSGERTGYHICPLDEVLERYPDFSDSKMLKTDTDGFDGKVIRGSVEFIKKNNPILFFEYDPFFLKQQDDNGLEIFALLKKYGYSGILVYDNFGELLICMPEIDLQRIEEIDLYFTGRKGGHYCDVCVFHFEDNDLFETSRNLEVSFFRDKKLSNNENSI